MKVHDQADLVTEEMRALIGTELPSVTAPEEVSRSEIRRFTQGLMDDNPLYYDPDYARLTRFGEPVAPGSFPVRSIRRQPGSYDPFRELDPDVYSFDEGREPRVRIAWPKGMADYHGQDDLEVYQLAKPGDVVTSKSRLVDVYEKRGRSGRLGFYVYETVFTNQNGHALCVDRYTGVVREEPVLQGKAKPVAPPKPPQAGPVELPKSRADWGKPTTPLFDDVEMGQRIPTITKALTVPIMMRWSAAIEMWARNHYDYEFTVLRLGLPDVIGSGSWTQATFYQLLNDWVGLDGWVWKSTQQNRGMLLPGDVYTVWGEVTGKTERDGLGFVALRLGMTRQDGNTITPGWGTVVLPLRHGRSVPYRFPYQCY